MKVHSSLRLGGHALRARGQAEPAPPVNQGSVGFTRLETP